MSAVGRGLLGVLSATVLASGLHIGGSPSISRSTSKSASTDRRATSRSAVFTVALSPRVPSTACAAKRALIDIHGRPGHMHHVAHQDAPYELTARCHAEGDAPGRAVACEVGGRALRESSASNFIVVGLQADGGLAAHVAVSPKTLHALPDEMGRVESGWVKRPPSRCAPSWPPGTSAAGRCSSSVAVRSGSCTCRLARPYGAARVWLSEPSAERRSYAKASQADRAFDPTVDAADIERLKVDVVLECSGSEPGIRSSVAAARPEGTVVVVGERRAGLDPIAILIKELRVVGSFTYADEFAEVLALLADGALQVADLTSEITKYRRRRCRFRAPTRCEHDEDPHRTERVVMPENGRLMRLEPRLHKCPDHDPGASSAIRPE